MDGVEILEGPAEYPIDPVTKFPFECDDFQKHSFNSIEAGNDVLVCVPTSGGKTVVAEYAILHAVLKTKQRVVYTSPIKSLSNQNYESFKKKFANTSVTVGLLTGDNKIDVDSNCLIVTAEILRNSMYKIKKKVENPFNILDDDFIDSIGCIIMDEVHYMNDKERGRVWEETFILAKKETQLVMLSATVSDPHSFASWIHKCHGNKISLISVSKRVIPLQHSFFVNNQLYPFLNENDIYNASEFTDAKNAYKKVCTDREKSHKPVIDKNLVPKLVKFLHAKNLLQAIFFSFSTNKCELYANQISEDLIDHSESIEIGKIFDHYVRPHMDKYKDVPDIDIVKKLLLKGVAYHHSKMMSILKEVIEIIFRKGLIKVLFATETFAVGVNSPTRTVVFTELNKYTNEKAMRFITTSEYKQMAGRAGRRGLDTFGNVIILPIYDFPDEVSFKNVIFGSIPKIESNFKWDYQFFLKMIQSETINMDLFFEKSLVGLKNKKTIDWLKSEKETLAKLLETTNNHAEKVIDKSIEEKPTVLKKIRGKKDSDSDDDFGFVSKTNKKGIHNKQTTVSTNKVDMDLVNKLIEYDDKTNSELFGIKVKLDKKSEQEYNNLKKMLKDPLFLEQYEKLNKRKDIQNQIIKLDSQIDGYEDYVRDNYEKLKQLLVSWDFITDDLIVNVKGIIASQINECNGIVLAEIIYNNYIDDLTPEEIVGLLAIFCEPSKIHQIDCDYSDNKISSKRTEKLQSKLDEIIDITEHMKNEENKVFGMHDSIGDWKITLSYVDYAIEWVSGASVVKILELLDGESTGNFVKNMIKISNMIIDIRCICKTIGKVELIPKLELIDSLILRDIVFVSSLYLK